MPHLIVREPGCVTYSFPLEGRLRAGREKDNDLVLPDRAVSRYHVAFEPDGEGFVVRDVGSTHGLFVNDVKTSARRLVDGDVIEVGNVVLTYCAENDPSVTFEFARTDPAGVPLSDRANRRVQLLCSIGESIGSTRDAEAFLHQLVVALHDVLGCERALVGLGQTPRDSIRKIARSNKLADDVVVSRSILEQVLGRRERAVFVEEPDARAAPTLIQQRIRAAVCVPMVAGSHVYGFLYVDDRREKHSFSPEDVQFLVALAHLAGGVLDGVELLREADARRVAMDRSEIVGACSAMVKLRELIAKFGPKKSSVLIHGETGTGKELVARALHAASDRRSKLMVAVNCAAIPDNLIESELFGHVRGAFSGAIRDKKGKFVLAHESTLFLDEIGDLSLTAQAKVLRVLQEGEVDPLGADKPTKVNVRIVAATHKDLEQEIAAKRFRQDLYFRLRGVALEVPPLRDRDGDVELLARSLLPVLAEREKKRFSGITPRALDVLCRYGWPGNVRELINELERAIILSESSTIDVGDLGELAPMTLGTAMPGQTNSLTARYKALDEMEKQLVIEALEEAEGNMSEAARLLDITWVMLRKRMARYGLSKKRRT